MQSATINFLNQAALPMTFKVFSSSSGEGAPNTVEMHVLAKAYRAAWRSQFINDPAGVHVIETLDLVIDFGGTDLTGRTALPDDSPFRTDTQKGLGMSAMIVRAAQLAREFGVEVNSHDRRPHRPVAWPCGRTEPRAELARSELARR